MAEIKHLLLENGVEELFKLIVEDSAFAGTYEIVKPDGWDEVDSVIDLSEEYFNVENFIIGESNKIKFLQYVEGSGFDIIKKVYNEKGGDGKILFKWLAVKNGVETDLLGDGFEINLNKYDEGYEKSMLRIETEIKKRESQSKLLNREDISVNLFSTKDLDNLDINPVHTEEILYKEGSRKKTNFYFYNIEQDTRLDFTNEYFPLFTISEDAEIGDQKNKVSGYFFVVTFFNKLKVNTGPLISTKSILPNIIIELSNFDFFATRDDGIYRNFKLFAVKKNGATIIDKIELKESTNYVYEGRNVNRINILNEKFNVGNLKENESLELAFYTNDNSLVKFYTINSSASIEVHANLATPMRKAKIVRLNEALNQICRLYTNGQITLQSSLLNQGGFYYNSAISTGSFLRGVANILLVEEKLTTSLKALLYDGVAPLLACGFDLQDNKLVVESIDYFFKDIKCYDLTKYDFLEENLKITNNVELSFNQLMFGSKKYSTGKNQDLWNGNTELEATTPIKTVKRKFDKKTDLIIDEDKIQSIILDQSTASKNSDDDLVLIDLVNVDNYQDEGVLTDAVHTIENGKLVLYSYENPFDVFPLSVGMNITITSGLNAGTYGILAIDKFKLTLNKTAGITTGTTETPIKFTVSNITKNRTNEGFLVVSGVNDSNTVVNLRHNPKYHLARWFGFFGSGFSKKSDSEEIIITDYKNNGNIRVQHNDIDVSNELRGETLYKANETLRRLRNYKNPFFNGQSIEITLDNIEFKVFFELYNEWRYGIKKRGYLRVKTNTDIIDIHPFGDKALEHSKEFNTLTIRGKVRKITEIKNKIFDSTFDETFE